MEKYIEKYWQHPRFYDIHLYLCFIFAFLGILVFGFSYFYASFGHINETGFWLLCFYAFSFCACSTFFIVASSQRNEKDIDERKDVIKGCWMWLCGFLPIVAGMTLWILYESSGYVLDYKLVVRPSPELTRELEFLTGKTFEEGFFDYSLEEQTVDMDLPGGHTANNIFVILTDPYYEHRLENDIRKYKMEAIVSNTQEKHAIELKVDWDSARFIGIEPTYKTNIFDRGTCHIVANFKPKVSGIFNVVGNGENREMVKKDLGAIPTFSIKNDKLYIDTRENGAAWRSFCAKHFKEDQPFSIDDLPAMDEGLIWSMKNQEIYILPMLLPALHEDIIAYYPVKRFILNFSLENFGRWI